MNQNILIHLNYITLWNKIFMSFYYEFKKFIKYKYDINLNILDWYKSDYIDFIN